MTKSGVSSGAKPQLLAMFENFHQKYRLKFQKQGHFKSYIPSSEEMLPVLLILQKTFIDSLLILYSPATMTLRHWLLGIRIPQNIYFAIDNRKTVDFLNSFIYEPFHHEIHFWENWFINLSVFGKISVKLHLLFTICTCIFYST